MQRCTKNAKPTILITVPKRMMHDHSFLWTVEKGVSASLLFVVPLGLLYPNFVLDNVMAVLIAAHSHWYFANNTTCGFVNCFILGVLKLLYWII